MRYHIDTIPVWDAFRAGGECPLCPLARDLESSMVGMCLGGSVMEPSSRIAVNEKGFCSRHARQLFEAGDRLPLALMLDTRLDTLLAGLGPLFDAALSRGGTSAGKAPLAERRALKRLLEDSRRSFQGCVVCERVDGIMDRYVDTLIDLWRKDREFMELMSRFEGFCLPHFTKVLDALLRAAPFPGRSPMIRTLCERQRQALRRIKDDVNGFTQKFNYKNAGKPWGSLRDALPRAIAKLQGYRSDIVCADGKNGETL